MGDQNLMLLGETGKTQEALFGGNRRFGGGGRGRPICMILIAVVLGGVGGLCTYRLAGNSAVTGQTQEENGAPGEAPAHPAANKPFGCLLKILCAKEWSRWGAWSDCSLTCGNGTQTRARSCSTNYVYDCAGKSQETRSCNTQCCTAAGYWLDWSAWRLSVVPSVEIRYRTCNDTSQLTGAGAGTCEAVSECDGLNSETRLFEGGTTTRSYVITAAPVPVLRQAPPRNTPQYSQPTVTPQYSQPTVTPQYSQPTRAAIVGQNVL